MSKRELSYTKVVKKPGLIAINSQLYDVNSGRLFHHPRGQVIDGFMKKPHASLVIKKVAATLTSDNLRPAQNVHKRPQRSKTLMRSIVKRPFRNQNAHTKSPKARNAVPSSERLSRAISTAKNSSVERFGRPIGQTTAAITQAVARSKPSLSGDVITSKSTASALALPTPPSLITSVSHQNLERLLDRALFQADAHKKALSGKGRGRRLFGRNLKLMPKWLTITLLLLGVTFAGAYFAWRNIPFVSMKVASMRAHVQGSLPTYVPSGFKFAGATKQDAGTISVTFKADNERYFTLEQKASKWDSASLEANAIPKNSPVETSQVKGSTVFNQEDSAMWVNGECLNKITHKGLNPSEINRIAGSILPSCG